MYNLQYTIIVNPYLYFIPVKRRIFIAIHYMELGGAERALLGLLESLDSGLYDIDLFVYSHRGDLMAYIPEHIHLLPENSIYSSYEQPLIRVLCRGHFLIVAARLWAKIANWWFNRYLFGQVFSELDEVGRLVTCVLPSLKYLGVYDVAISFLTPHYIVRDKVRARKKIAWIHTDYSTIRINAARELAVWDSYDHIVSISHDVTKAFVGVFPTLASKIIEQDNLLPVSLIQKQASAFNAAPEMPGAIRLLSIGRFCAQKNFPEAVEIMAELCKLRDDVTWYLIGYGSDEMSIREKIRSLGMQDKFIVLGKKTNPYPYITACDLYVQPSIYEGNAVTVKEAQLLGRPVAITRYPTAASQVRDGVDGFILPLGDPVKTAQALHAVLSDARQLERVANCAQMCIKEQHLSMRFAEVL